MEYRLNRWMVAVTLFIFTVAAMAGLKEDLDALRTTTSEQRRSIKTESEMKGLAGSYMAACREILSRYDLSALETEDRRLAAGVLLEIRDYQRALDLMLPVAEGEHATDMDRGLVAAALFGTDSVEQGLQFLDRMNREENPYLQACMQESALRIQRDEPADALLFLKRLLGSASVTGSQRMEVIRMATLAYSQTGQVDAAADMLRVESRNRRGPRSMREEMKKMRRRLLLIGKPAADLHGVGAWIHGDPVQLSASTGIPKVAVFLHRDMFRSPVMLQLLALSRELGPEKLQLLIVTQVDEPEQTSTLGTGAPDVAEAERNRIITVSQEAGLSACPMAVLTDVTSFWAYNVSAMPQIIVIDGAGMIRDVLWPPLLATQIDRSIRAQVD